MSVSLTITLPNGETEFLPYAGQITAATILEPMARALGHQWTPLFHKWVAINKASLVDVLREVNELRQRVAQEYPKSLSLLDSFNQIIQRLEELQTIDKWEASFG